MQRTLPISHWKTSQNGSREVESSLLDALQSVAKFTWQMVELVYAQDSFLERCIPLLDPDDHKRFRLAAKAIARFCGILAEHDFRYENLYPRNQLPRRCRPIDIEGCLDPGTGAANRANGSLRSRSVNQRAARLNVAALAKEFEQRGYREMGFALRYHPRDRSTAGLPDRGVLLPPGRCRRGELEDCVRRYATRKRTLAARSAPQRD